MLVAGISCSFGLTVTACSDTSAAASVLWSLAIWPKQQEADVCHAVVCIAWRQGCYSFRLVPFCIVHFALYPVCCIPLAELTLSFQVAKLKQSSAQSKADKKAEKKANKEAKKANKRAADQMETALAAPGVGSDPFTNGTSSRQQLETASAPRHNYRSHSHSHRDHDHAQPSSRQHDRDRSYHGDGLDDAHTHKHRRLHSPERQHDRHRSSHAHRDEYSDRRHASESERRQHSSHDHRDERSDRPHAGEAGRHQHSSHVDRIAPSDRRHVRESDRHQHSNHARSGSAAEPARPHAIGHANGHASENGLRLDGTKYGLSWGDTAPEELQGRDR